MKSTSIGFSPDIVILGFYTPDVQESPHFLLPPKPLLRAQGDQLQLALQQYSPTELLETYNSGQKQISTDGFYSLAYLRRNWKICAVIMSIQTRLSGL